MSSHLRFAKRVSLDQLVGRLFHDPKENGPKKTTDIARWCKKRVVWTGEGYNEPHGSKVT